MSRTALSRAALATTAGLAATAVLLAGCAASDPGAGASGDGGIEVVATTTIWGDVAREVVTCASSGSVATLMPVGADPHDFTASSKDVAVMAAADLVIANGLGLEEGLEDSLAAVAQEGVPVLELAPLLDPMPFGESAHSEEEDGEHAEGEEDGHDGDEPLVLLDVARVATAATLIGAELAEQAGDQAFATCGEQVAAELTTLETEIETTLGSVPADQRILVTDHDAFGYFAAAYDFEVAGVVIPGGSTLAKPSSAEMAALTQTVRATGVPAIFANTANPQALVEALAAEVGDIDVVDLYVGSLGEAGSGADTYQGMMRTNAQRITDALAG
jgi:zinc/manganese transport system substrate-binding protein